MTIRIAINGFGRMGRLAMREVWDWPDIEIIHINEIACDAYSSAHLVTFDSAHGRGSKKSLVKAMQFMSATKKLAIQ